MNNPRKPIPSFQSDKDAEEFVEQADLTEYDLSGFKPMKFEFAKKEATLNLRVPSSLLQAVKAKAASQGIPYTRYVRMILEEDLRHHS